MPKPVRPVSALLSSRPLCGALDARAVPRIPLHIVDSAELRIPGV